MVNNKNYFSNQWIDNLPIPLIEFDLSKVKQHITTLTDTITTSVKTYFKENREELATCIKLVKVMTINQPTIDLYRVSSAAEFEFYLKELIGDQGVLTIINGTTALVEGKTVFEEETINRRLGGGTIIVLLKFSVLHGHEENLERVIVSVTDITKSKRLDREIDILALLPEANPNIILILECPDIIEYINPAGRQWLAAHHFAVINDIHHILPDHFSSNICRYCDKISEQQHKIVFQDEIFDLKLKPLIGMSRCMITLTDVTEFEKISRERRLYYEAFQSSIHAMMISSPDGRIQYINPKFEEIYGYSFSSARGKKPNILNPGKRVYFDLGFSEQEHDQLFSDMWRQIQDPTIGFWEGEIPNRRKNGEIIWVHLIINAIYNAEGKITNYLAIPVDISETRMREMNIRLDIYKTITNLAEMRDNETGRHIIRVGKYARMIGEKLALSTKFCRDIETFSPLHDIGKVGISDLILLAERKLTPEEFGTMKTHTTLGYQLLAGKPTLEMAADIAYAHHERYDGSGYPQGLAGEQIPLCARITTCVDIYDALRSDRPYKKAWPHEESINEIKTISGTTIDPEITDAFLGLQDEIVKIATEYRD